MPFLSDFVTPLFIGLALFGPLEFSTRLSRKYCMVTGPLTSGNTKGCWLAEKIIANELLAEKVIANELLNIPPCLLLALFDCLIGLLGPPSVKDVHTCQEY